MVLYRLIAGGLLACTCMALSSCSAPEETGKAGSLAEDKTGGFWVSRSVSEAADRSTAKAATDSGAFGFLFYQWFPIGDWRDSTESLPETIAIGDVTGDGRNDVVMVTLRNHAAPLLEIDHKVFVYEQNSNGGLEPPRLYPYTEGLYEHANNFINASIVLADMNSDDTDDILVGYGKGVTALLSGPDGFTSRVFLMAPEFRNLDPMYDNYHARHLEVLDINRDGRRDMLLFNRSSAATALYGDGKGGVLATESLLHEVRQPFDAKVADYDGDGYEDVAVLSGSRTVRTIWIARNIGGRGFGPVSSYWLQEDETYGGIAMGDWNGDKRTDVAVSVPKNIQAYGWPAGVLIFEQDQSGQLAAPYSIPTMDIPHALISTDLDGDRKEDLIVEHNGWGKIGYMLQSQGALRPELLVQSGNPGFNTRPFAAGDINNDGCKDIAVADRTNGLGILIAQNCQKQSQFMSSPLPPRVSR